MSNSEGASGHFILSTLINLLYGRLKCWALIPNTGCASSRTARSPSLCPLHRPGLPLQPRNKDPPTTNTASRGGREGCPYSPTFPKSHRDAQWFQRATLTKHQPLRNALGLCTFQLRTRQLLSRAAGSQPSGTLRSVAVPLPSRDRSWSCTQNIRQGLHLGHKHRIPQAPHSPPYTLMVFHFLCQI